MIYQTFTITNLHRTFDYDTPLTDEEATRGSQSVLPRALNMYENYPFWYTFFTELGYKVVVSPAPPSSKSLYLLGIESIPSQSQNVTLQSLAHGHVDVADQTGSQGYLLPMYSI